MGQFVGFSDKHSSLVANVRHLSTNFISPQFHVVFDDVFETVNRTGVDEPAVESICQDLFQLNRELYAEEELDKASNLIYQPPSSMRSGLMKLDKSKVTRIAYDRGVGTMTSCMITIKQSNRLFLLLSQ
jgi:hypothetical protein